MHCHGIDCKVAAIEVLVDIGYKFNLRLAAFMVIALSSESGDFDKLAVALKADGAEPFTCSVGTLTSGLHFRLHLVRAVRCAEVEILGFFAEHQITRRAAD